MTLPTKTYAQIVTDLVTAWSNNLGITPTLSPGDALFAIFQSVAAQFDFIQSEVELVNQLSRAQTSVGADLDSWMAQFNFFREGADFAEGPVTFSKLTPAASQILVPAGTIVQTTGGGIQYQVIADTTQPTWNATYNAYVLAIGQSSLNATVIALVSGSGSNVTTGQIDQIASSVPGIDQVVNNAPISNGQDAESDDAFRARFVLYLASLAQATETAILSAVASVQQGLQVKLLENQNPPGTTMLGAFTVVVDNGTGSPPSNLLTAVYNAVYAARAFTIQAYVTGPTVITGVVVLSIRVASGYTSSAVQTAVKNAILVLINGNNIGSTLFVSQIESAALAVAGVISVEPGTTINSVNADLVPAAYQAVRSSAGNITVGTY